MMRTCSYVNKGCECKGLMVDMEPDNKQFQARQEEFDIIKQKRMISCPTSVEQIFEQKKISGAAV